MIAQFKEKINPFFAFLKIYFVAKNELFCAFCQFWFTLF